MSRSYRTEKVSRIATRRLRKNSSGELILPRIVERRPAKGDAHPIPAGVIRRILGVVPVEYVYGLRLIELRARQNSVGLPFAFYRPGERKIVIYSVPPVWEFELLPPSLRRSLKRFHAAIADSPARTMSRITWNPPEFRTVWFAAEVLAHEFGHHLRFQYRHKNGRFGRRVDEELVAQLHSERFMKKEIARLRARRRKVSGS
jgi:hypothetical protein